MNLLSKMAAKSARVINSAPGLPILIYVYGLDIDIITKSSSLCLLLTSMFWLLNAFKLVYTSC